MANQLKSYVVGACLSLLRPIVRMLLKNGVMHGEFVELSKDVYVSVATEEFGMRGRPTSVSRVALLTGMDRKVVSRVKARLAGSGQTSEAEHTQDRISRTLAGWHQDPDFTDPAGRPLRLPIAGPTPSYEALIARYGGDVPATAILRELRRVNAIADNDGKLTALRRNYRLAKAEPQAVTRAGSVLRDIGETVVHNLYVGPDEQSRFEARASNTRIPNRVMPAYRTFVRAESQVFLERVDAWLSEHEAGNDTPDSQLVRTGIGIYWIQNEPGQLSEAST